MAEHRSVRLRASEGRAVEVQIFLPPSGVPSRPDSAIPVIFSHGANSSPALYCSLLDIWADAGFFVCAPLHIDSEDHPQRNITDRALVRQTRLEDFALVAASLGNGSLGVRASSQFVSAGHSYGALIAQVAGGALLEGEAQADIPAIALPSCVIALSPPPPMPDFVSEQGWSAISAPMLCVTGTRDEMPGFVDDWRLHLVSHHAAPHSFAIVFDDMDHYFNGAFGRLDDRDDNIAVDLLNAEIINFIRVWTCGETISPEQWTAQSSPTVQRLA